jgi:hypothetical protein
MRKSPRNPEEQKDRKKETLSDQPQLVRVTPTALLGSWVLQPIKGMTSLGTDFESVPYGKDLLRNPLQQNRSKEGPHYCIDQSARDLSGT